MGHDKCEHINSENSRKTPRFSETIWEVWSIARKTISKFLGNIPSEQTFTEIFRWVPLILYESATKHSSQEVSACTVSKRGGVGEGHCLT